MKTAFGVTWIAALLGMAISGPVHAQAGPFIDWLQKLSGPQFWPAGATVSFGYWPGQRIDSSTVNALGVKLRRIAAPSSLDSIRTELHRRLATCRGNLADDRDWFARGLAFHEGTVDRLRVEGRRLMAASGDTSSEAFVREEYVVSLCAWQNALSNLARDFRRVDPEHGFVVRLGVFRGHDTVHEEDGTADGDTADVEMFTFQPTLEYRRAIARRVWILSPDLGIESGVSVHYFHGQDIVPFWHISVPVLVNLHPFARHSWLLLRGLRIGGGGHVFTPFRRDAFAPGIRDLDEGTEFVGTLFAAFELSLNTLGIPGCGC